MKKVLFIGGILFLVVMCGWGFIANGNGNGGTEYDQRIHYAYTPAPGDTIELVVTQQAQNQGVMATQSAHDIDVVKDVAGSGLASNVAIVTADKASAAIPNCMWPMALIFISAAVIVFLFKKK